METNPTQKLFARVNLYSTLNYLFETIPLKRFCTQDVNFLRASLKCAKNDCII